MTSAMTPDVFYVANRTQEFAGTSTLEICRCDHGPLPVFEPGQFNMLYAFGAGEVPISMSGPTPKADSPNHYTHTIRSLGSVTQALERLREGDQVGVRGPFGRGWPADLAKGKTALIIAGGLGLAPLRPLLYQLLADSALHASPTAQDIRLFYGAKSPADILFGNEIQNWSQHLSVYTSVDCPSASWHGNVGAITGLLTSTHFDPANTVAYICGPEIMMRFAIQELIKHQLPRASIYLSMERNMKCAIGHCGHCQWGPTFICKEGPVFCYEDIEPWFHTKAL